MPLYFFEYWVKGDCSELSIQSESVQSAVVTLSDQYKEGVFRLKQGKVICAWCKKEMSDLPGLSSDTHGICDKCRKAEWKRFLSSKGIKEND